MESLTIIPEIADIALKKGTNGCLKQLLKSYDFYQRRSFFEKIDDKKSKILSLGPLKIGEILRKNGLNEENLNEELLNFPVQAISKENWFLPTIIDLVGKKLIKAAASTLPEETKNLVEKWRSGNVEKQISVLKSIFYLLRAPQQKQIISDINSLIQFEKESNLDQGIHRFLPALFKKNKNPNCLGKEIQLVSFFELCGAKCYSASVIKPITETDIEITQSLISKINKDLEKRGIENDSKFQESLSNQMEMMQIILMNEIKFHSAVIVQLADKRWAIVDPFGICWGILPEKAQIQVQKIDKILSKYSTVLPGLSLPLFSSDKELILKAHSLLDEWLEKSIQAENQIRKCKNNDELVETIINSKIFNELLESPTIKDYKEIIEKALPTAKKQIAKALFIEPFANFPFKKIGDEILTLYHLTGLSKATEWFDEARESGEIIHSCLEIIKSSYSVGVGVISDMAIILNNNFDLSEEIAKFSFTQKNLCNVLQGYCLKSYSRSLKKIKLSNFALKCLDLLKKEEAKHFIVRQTLKELDELLKRRNYE